VEISRIIGRETGLTSKDCLACDVCCRFPEPTSLLAPFFSHEEIEHALAAGLDRDAFPPGRYGCGHAVMLTRAGTYARCPAFDATENRCTIYDVRPLDCRLYPFMLMYDRDGAGVWLALDAHCPALSAPERREGVERCARRLASVLDGPGCREVARCRGVVGEWKPYARPLVHLAEVSKMLCRSDLGLRRLTASARDRVAGYFSATRPALSMYSFASVQVWSCAFDLWWKTIGQRLLLIARGDGDCFLIVPPLGEGDLTGPAAEAVWLMGRLQPDGASPRIQDADDAACEKLAAAGWTVAYTSREYVYSRCDLAELRGNRYEKKRQMCNRFERDYRWSWRPFVPADFWEVATLYRTWLAERCAAHPEILFAAQAEVSFRCLIHALKDPARLGLVARVLEAEGRIVGITAGTPLADGRSFFVMFEVADRSVRGAAQFMFREFCRELGGFEWINAGGTSRLPTLEKVKESYRPLYRPRAHILAPAQGDITSQ